MAKIDTKAVREGKRRLHRHMVQGDIKCVCGGGHGKQGEDNATGLVKMRI